MVDFIDCIQKDRKPELTVYDGTKATIVTYAITDSSTAARPSRSNIDRKRKAAASSVGCRGFPFPALRKRGCILGKGVLK